MSDPRLKEIYKSNSLESFAQKSSELRKRADYHLERTEKLIKQQQRLIKQQSTSVQFVCIGFFKG